MNQHELLGAMKLCAQNEHQSVHDHGYSVCDHLADLYEPHPWDDKTTATEEWRLPSWLHEYREQINSNLYDWSICAGYAIFHDCGKPFCRIVDHDSDRYTISNLIGWDMALHVSNSEEIERLCREEWTVQDAVTLLLTALAEVHSNAKMFGGIEATSFKAKWKQIDRRGKQILKFYFPK
jgi:hypothetical protein